MSEMAKTVGLVAVAAVVGLAAFIWRPQAPGITPDKMVGEKLFPEFKDPAAATSLEIVDYDESNGAIRPFNVAKTNGVWSIPSHEGYPADAKEQMGRAAAALLDLDVLQVLGDSPSDHETYGVVDPDPKTLKPGATGVGTRVVLRDAGGKTLVGLVVGKAVPDRGELHFVRRIGQDTVFAVAIKTDKLSAKFEDWIEKNLLKMETLDFQRAAIRDYSVDLIRHAIASRGNMAVDYNESGDPKWKLTEDVIFHNDQEIPGKLAPDEELNATKLDDLKREMVDLKIVDVSRKPKGLGADLKATGEFGKNVEAVRSLQERGFYPVDMDGALSLFSNEGEIHALMKTGVEYVLRFGAIAGDSSSLSGHKKDEKKPGEKEAAKTGLNRYLFVVAQFNPSVLPKPVLEKLPEDKPAPQAEAKKPAAKEAKDAKKAEAKPEAKPDLKAERERIEKENKRKQEEYDAKVKSGQDKVKELNARFGDWYYVISDEVYGKIHLSRADIIKKKEKDKDKSKEAGHEHDGHDHDAHDHGPADPAASSSVAPSELDKLQKAAPSATEKKK